MTINAFMLWWVLPSLVVFLLNCIAARSSGTPFEDLGSASKRGMFISAWIYPIGIGILLWEYWPALIKERRWK